MKLKISTDQKRGMKNCSADFQDIVAYRDQVNQKVFQNIRDGTFQKISNLNELGNLMEYEDEQVFGIKITQTLSVTNPNQKPRSGVQRKAIPLLYQNYDPRSKSFKFLNQNTNMNMEEMRQMQEKTYQRLQKENKQRIIRFS